MTWTAGLVKAAGGRRDCRAVYKLSTVVLTGAADDEDCPAMLGKGMPQSW
jgi:hypothetical protein